ncbi:YtpI family protein [Paenibacillus agri]|uniref:YtpI family protein n=1 Tax=Paenibacillus agri TaxID=2744309 RepID=A0A850EWM8_9BACL|nr:YtpI family protein [Paenibacillus agri]NUU63884.1 YtpI family protein [Paenibacillus agri]
MIMFVKYTLFILLVAFVIGAAYYSFASRRSTDPVDRGLKKSFMNMLLGAMLLTLAMMSMFLYRGSTVGIIVEAAFLIIGIFNLFSGLRSFGHYSRLKIAAEDKATAHSASSKR